VKSGFFRAGRIAARTLLARGVMSARSTVSRVGMRLRVRGALGLLTVFGLLTVVGLLGFLAFLGLFASGCASRYDDPEWRAARAERRMAAHEARMAQADCQARLEVYPPGMRPQRPYRVLGPVDGTWGFTIEARFQRMRKKACELGAQAIIDADERYEVVAGTTQTVIRYDRHGRPVAVIEQPQSTIRRTSAWAIVFTNEPL
jgi:hypothetical protein